MGFFASGGSRSGKGNGQPSVELLHKLQCKICPLAKVRANKHPHMAPTGSAEPLIYVLGEAPGEIEDRKGVQFVGRSGELLRARIPDDFLPLMRFNNVVRTRPPNNRDPEFVEIEACRPSIEQDILKTRPKAIFGFGNVPLKWAIGQAGIRSWRGRKIPLDIAGHLVWYFPFTHPLALLRLGKRAKYDLAPEDIGSEDERAFTFDLERAFALVDELPEPNVLYRADLERDIELIECTSAGLDKLESALDWFAQQPVCGVDYETNALRPYGEGAAILSAAVATPRRAVGIPFDHPQANWSPRNRKRLADIWKRFLQTKVRKAAHNFPFEAEWMGFMFGERLLRRASFECTLQQAFALDERAMPGRSESSLDFLMLNNHGIHLKGLSPLDRANLAKEPLPDVLRYNAMDSRAHCYLWLAQDAELSVLGLQSVYRENLRSIPTLVLTQLKGVPVSQTEVNKLRTKYEARVADARAEIADQPEVKKFEQREGKTYNPGSNPDTVTLLRDIMKRREGKQENGRYSVEEDVLKLIDAPISTALLKFRKATKRLSTYVEPYARTWPDGLLHPIINPSGTISNRTSSEEPNIQNIPKRDPEAKEVRRQIVAPEGYLYCAIDYGQIQARGIAMMSRDKAFCKSLWERYDVHTEWAERISRAYPARVGGKQNFTDKAVMKAFRTDIKNQWTFPLFFGAQLPGVSQFLEIPERALKREFDLFWEVFHGVKDWQESLLKIYRQEGIVRHLDGRLNRAPLSQNQIFNYPIQGVERQIVLDGMNRLSEKEVSEYQAPLEIHDDLTFLFPERDIDRYVEEAVTQMLDCRFDFINVPITVEVSIGENLFDMEEVLVAASDTWKR